MEEKMLKKMSYWLMNISNMRKTQKDLSDYHFFIDCAALFLKTEVDHFKYQKSFLKAIKKTKKHSFISFLYTICSLLNVEKNFISENTIKKHFKIKSCRPAIIKYLNCFGISILDSSIKKCLVEDENFLFPSLFNLISQRKEYFFDFLYLNDEKYVFRQLEIISNCIIAINLVYYAGFLGDSSKLIAFKTFETLSTILGDLTKKDGSPDEELGDYFYKNGRPFIKIGKPKIDNPIHFLSFGFEFLEERSDIIKILNLKNPEEKCIYLNKILAKYGYSKGLDIGDIHKISLCYRNGFDQPNISKLDAELSDSSIYDADFDYLFENKSRKDICDCLEF